MSRQLETQLRRAKWISRIFWTCAIAALIAAPFAYTAIQKAFFTTAVFAPGYSEAAFNQVKIGMTRDEVVALLGEPLLVKPQGAEIWIYQDTAPSSEHRFHLNNNGIVFYEEHRGPGFDQHNGMDTVTKQDLQEFYGEPAQKESGHNALALWYAQPLDETKSLQRIIYIVGDTGKVGAIWARP